MTRRALTAFLWLLAAGFFARLGLHSLREAGRPTDGFAAYYVSARLVREGAPVARFYDETWFADRVEERLGVRDGFTPNPPPLAFLMLPLTGLPHAEARALFTALSLLLLAGTVALLGRELDAPPLLLAGFAAFACVCRPVRSGFAHAQVYVPIAFLLALAFVAARRRRDALFGASAGAALVVKAALPFIWLWGFAARRWRALVLSVAAVLAVAVATLPRVGIAAWEDAVRWMARSGAKPGLAIPFYQSVPGLLRRLFGADPLVPAAPLLLHSPVLEKGLAVLAAVAAVALALRAGTAGARCLPALAVAGLLATPLTGGYHYALALPAVAVLLFELPSRRSAGRAVLLAVAIVLMALAPERPGDPRSLLAAAGAYPLVGAGALLLLLLAGPSRSASEQTQRAQTGSVPTSS